MSLRIKLFDLFNRYIFTIMIYKTLSSVYILNPKLRILSPLQKIQFTTAADVSLKYRFFLIQKYKPLFETFSRKDKYLFLIGGEQIHLVLPSCHSVYE